ncbi:MAG: hypothetical protein E6Q98_15030 [Rhodospirillaceae bacterium]|nr:MAG: hypothetical protein E6Q98_15030 [Rhodospirillaceae bacterium]
MAEGTKPLKETNKTGIAIVLVMNVIVYYLAVKTDALLSADYATIYKSVSEGVPAGLLLILTSIVNAQISPANKARIVFMRWDNPLPGSYAFTKYAHEDPRVDVSALEKKYNPLPTDPKDQNRLWYKLYKTVEDEAAVLQVHREYLFSRDYNGIALLMLIGLGAAGFYQIPSLKTASLYLLALLIQFLLTGQAARHHGKRFVTSVLARCAAREG